MKKITIISSLILLAAVSVAHAETTTTTSKLPGDQGSTSVNKNLEKNPDNKGLNNASEQLKKNQIKHTEQAEKRSEKHERHTEHHEGMGRPAKIERPGK